MSRPSRREVLLAGLIIFSLIAVRLVPHLPNFSPVLAIALMCGYLFQHQVLRWGAPVAGVMLSDLFLGTYGFTMYIVWGCYALAALGAGRYLRKMRMMHALTGAVIAATGFFVVTNLAVWAEGTLYPRNWAGLIDCYVAAIPFFRMTLISTVLYMLLAVVVERVVVRNRLAIREAQGRM